MHIIVTTLSHYPSNHFVTVSNFHYCPLVYHIWGKGNSLKIEPLFEHGICIVFDDFEIHIKTHMERSNVSTLFWSRFRHLAVDVFKVLNGMSLQISKDFYQVKDVSYSLKKKMIHVLVQPFYSTKPYGFNSLSYLGAKLWNLIPGEF